MSGYFISTTVEVVWTNRTDNSHWRWGASIPATGLVFFPERYGKREAEKLAGAIRDRSKRWVNT